MVISLKCLCSLEEGWDANEEIKPKRNQGRKTAERSCKWVPWNYRHSRGSSPNGADTQSYHLWIKAAVATANMGAQVYFLSPASVFFPPHKQSPNKAPIPTSSLALCSCSRWAKWCKTTHGIWFPGFKHRSASKVQLESSPVTWKLRTALPPWIITLISRLSARELQLRLVTWARMCANVFLTITLLCSDFHCSPKMYLSAFVYVYTHNPHSYLNIIRVSKNQKRQQKHQESNRGRRWFRLASSQTSIIGDKCSLWLLLLLQGSITPSRW